MANRVEAAAVAVAPLRQRFIKVLIKKRYLYLMMVPVLAWYIVFQYAPMYGIVLAFQDFRFSRGFASPFVGFDNFIRLFTDKNFQLAFRNTVVINVLRFIFGVPVPVLFALLLNEVFHSGFKRMVQTVTYLPHFVSWVILAGITYRILGYEADSPINLVRSLFGQPSVALMGEQSFFLPLVVITAIFKEVGWGTIIYLAAMSTINPELYEQGEIDGAGRLRQAWNITLPGILPIIAILLVLQIPGILQAGLDQIYNLANAATRRVAYITDIYVIRIGLMQGQYSFATAVGLIYSVVGLALTLIANRVSKGSVGHGIF
jgi:putative aldouronate transport system permease protein